MNDVQTFKAENMQAALDLVRANLGSDSVILHTREVSRPHWLPFKKPIVEIEITASRHMQPHIASKARKKLSHADESTQTQTTQTGQRKPAPKRNQITENKTSEPVSRNESVASRMTSRLQDEDELDSVTISPQIKKMVSSLSGSSPVSEALRKQPAQPQRPQRTAPKQTSRPAPAQNKMPAPKEIQPKPRQASPAPNRMSSPASGFSSKSLDDFTSRLETIEKMIQQLGRNQQMPVSNDVPGEVFQLYSELIDSGVDHETARTFVIHLKEHSTLEQLDSYEESHRLLTSLIESSIQTSGPIEAVKGKRKVVALVGATGVGKTTTLAKLAGNFRLRGGIRVGLVTVDTYRVAAVDQLKTYAEIIDLPMKVVKNPSEMRQALDEFIGLDLVLIDTAGRSPRDELKIQELKTILKEAQVDEVHLVMSLTSSIDTLKATIQKFAPANPTSLVITKLDEAGGMGPLLSLMHQVSVPVSYLTMGQDVPNDIEPGQPNRIARLITGKEPLFSLY